MDNAIWYNNSFSCGPIGLIFKEIKPNKPEIGIDGGEGANDIRPSTNFSVEAFKVVGSGTLAKILRIKWT